MVLGHVIFIKQKNQCIHKLCRCKNKCRYNLSHQDYIKNKQIIILILKSLFKKARGKFIIYESSRLESSLSLCIKKILQIPSYVKIFGHFEPSQILYISVEDDKILVSFGQGQAVKIFDSIINVPYMPAKEFNKLENKFITPFLTSVYLNLKSEK